MRYRYNQRSHVELGAALLDEKRPGWAGEIRGAMTRGLFDMASWESCVAGTLEMVRINEGQLEIRLNGTRLVVDAEFDRYGFVAGRYYYRSERSISDYAAWEDLDELWREQVDKRLDSPA